MEISGGRPAGFWVRVGSSLVDAIIVACIEFPIDRLFGIDYNNLVIDIKSSAAILISLTIVFFYYGWFYKNKGATPGKMLMGLRIINKNNGKNPDYFRSFFRETFGKVCSAFPFMIGFLLVAFRDDKRALHDLIFDTQVLMQKGED